MLDRRKRLQRDIVAHLVRDVPGFLPPTAIPNASIIEQMGIERAPLATFAPTSAAASAFRQLWVDIAERVWT
jgi:cellulose biosynthesis protein BcsQ